MERLGLGHDALKRINPRLIYCSVSGFGASGPLKDRPSFDIVTQALSGVMSLNGDPDGQPVKLGLPLGDMVGGIYGSVAVLSALHERGRTGKGRSIDISLHDGMLGMLGYLAQIQFVTGRNPQRVGNGHPNIVPYGGFAASDGTVMVACLTPVFWPRLCKAIGCDELIDDPRFCDLPRRIKNRDALNALLRSVFLRLRSNSGRTSSTRSTYPMRRS